MSSERETTSRHPGAKKKNQSRALTTDANNVSHTPNVSQLSESLGDTLSDNETSEATTPPSLGPGLKVMFAVLERES